MIKYATINVFLVTKMQSTNNNTSWNKATKNSGGENGIFLYSCFVWQEYFWRTEIQSMWAKRRKYSTTIQILPLQPNQHLYLHWCNNEQLLVGSQRGDEVAKLKVTLPMMSDFWQWQCQSATKNDGWEETSHPRENTIRKWLPPFFPTITGWCRW